MNINNIIIVILILALLFIGYNYTYNPNIVVKTDTIYKEIKLAPIKFIDTFKITKYKNNYIEVKVKDSSKIKIIDSLLLVQDSLNNTLKSLNLTQKAVLDTIYNKDTIFVSYEILNKVWDVNLRFYPRFEKIEKETIYIKENNDNKYYYLGGGFVGGLILGVLIK